MYIAHTVLDNKIAHTVLDNKTFLKKSIIQFYHQSKTLFKKQLRCIYPTFVFYSDYKSSKYFDSIQFNAKIYLFSKVWILLIKLHYIHFLNNPKELVAQPYTWYTCLCVPDITTLFSLHIHRLHPETGALCGNVYKHNLKHCLWHIEFAVQEGWTEKKPEPKNNMLIHPQQRSCYLQH